MFRLTLATFVVAVLAVSAAACPPVAVSSYGVQVQSGCFAPAVAVQAYAAPVAVQAYAVPQAVVVQQAYPQAVVVQQKAFAVKAFAAPSVQVNVNQRRFFPRLFGPRVNVRVR